MIVERVVFEGLGEEGKKRESFLKFLFLKGLSTSDGITVSSEGRTIEEFSNYIKHDIKNHTIGFDFFHLLFMYSGFVNTLRETRNTL